MKIELEGITVNENNVAECKGLVYRAHVECYMGNRGEAVRKVSFKPIKRLSCPGCSKCGPTIDDLKEELLNTPSYVVGFDTAEHGKLYELVIVVDGYEYVEGYSTGYADDWHVEFKLYKERLEEMPSYDERVSKMVSDAAERLISGRRN